MGGTGSPGVVLLTLSMLFLLLSQAIPNAAASYHDDVDVFGGSKCTDTDLHEDRYTITRTGDGEHKYCLLIEGEEDIPASLKGTQSFGETCDPTSTDLEQKCKLYVRDGNCLKPTHLRCEPLKRICTCTADGLVLPAVRFQFGTSTGKKQNITHGRCLVRPTFDSIHRVDCAPGTKLVQVLFDEDEPPRDVCGCGGVKAEKFDATDANWWKCSEGPMLFGMRKEWLLLVVWMNFLLR